MDYRKYLAVTSVDADELLEDWRWLIGPELRLWRVTKAGGALLQDPSDGSIHFLDSLSGTVERIAGNERAFEVAVASPANADRWLIPGLVDSRAASGIRPAENQCLSSKHPPMLGGGLDPDNFETCSESVHFSITGQIHQQIKDLPPGARIGRIEIEGRRGGGGKRPWWKFW
jgi:hypothetical protein